MDFLDLLTKDNWILVRSEKREVFITGLVSSQDLSIQTGFQPPIQAHLGPPIVFQRQRTLFFQTSVSPTKWKHQYLQTLETAKKSLKVWQPSPKIFT
jgi:hypothetical protein